MENVIAQHTLKTLEQFSEIGLKLIAEKDVAKLLELILTESMKLTGSDAGSLYIKEKPEEAEDGNPKLIFTYTHNMSTKFPFNAFKLPITPHSIAGACAMTGNIYNFATMQQTETELGFKHNRSFDESYGYETCNMLTLPLKNYSGDIIGVMQLINKKIDPEHIFTPYSHTFSEYVKNFTEGDVKLVSTLASQAAILLERSLLFEDIEHLLDSMIHTLVTALDQRDPITAGHSLRVSSYAMALADAVTKDDNYFKDFQFSPEEMRELKIAGMLHDVGKIGVREYVLMKQNKLSDDSILQIKWRYKYLALQFQEEASFLNSAYLKLETINKSGFLNDEDLALLNQLKTLEKCDASGEAIKLLTDSEYECLSVKRGNLTAAERKEINDHVVHSYRILSGIDWTKNLKQVPRIASDHHEKLNGTGYPEGRNEAQLEIRSRILAIADIFDALTAKDRPYKPAIPIPKSLDILKEEAEKGGLDPILVQLFIEKNVYEEAEKWHSK